MLWVKATHLLFVIAWMAGIFYLPRILVHYVEATGEEQCTDRLVIMAGKLFGFSGIMGILAIASGILLWRGFGFSGTWLHLKMMFVLLLVAYQWQCYRYIRQMRQGEVIRSSLFFRIFNESALLILIPVLILVVVKPFQ